MALKKWNDLSPSSQKRLKSQGIGPQERAAAIKRQGKWGSLSPAYRRRVEKSIGKKGYLEGQKLSAARGHASTPERPKWQRLAIALDIEEVVPDFQSLSSGEREKMGEAWVEGFMTPGPHTDRQKMLRMDFEDMFYAKFGHDMTAGPDGDWAAFRKSYRTKFTEEKRAA